MDQSYAGLACYPFSVQNRKSDGCRQVQLLDLSGRQSLQRAFRKLVSMLKPTGVLIISLRNGPVGEDRDVFPVSVEEIEHLALQHGIALKRVHKSDDRMGRSDVTWQTVCLQLPGDGTEALPLLRHMILKDSKSTTYKLALLRILVRIADSAIGMVRDVDDEFVSIPLGLVALYWVRMYKPLIEASIPQKAANKDQRGLGFVRESFGKLRPLSPFDLRVGAVFQGEDGEWLRRSLIDAKNTIHKMPAYYITYPNSSEQIFKAKPDQSSPRSREFILNEEFLFSFGEMHIPRHIWQAMSRFAVWIEPVLVTEWIRLMQEYSLGHGVEITYDQLVRALTWLEPDRDTTFVRSITKQLVLQDVPVYCVWSGKRLESTNLDIDHCFPFAAWPCGDLWNLLPADRRINQHQKADKLVTASALSSSRDRICEWWERAYLNTDFVPLRDRFLVEAHSSLPTDLSDGSSPSVDSVFEGVLVKRANLKRDLQLRDWELRT